MLARPVALVSPKRRCIERAVTIPIPHRSKRSAVSWRRRSANVIIEQKSAVFHLKIEPRSGFFSSVKHSAREIDAQQQRRRPHRLTRNAIPSENPCQSPPATGSSPSATVATTPRARFVTLTKRRFGPGLGHLRVKASKPHWDNHLRVPSPGGVLGGTTEAVVVAVIPLCPQWAPVTTPLPDAPITNLVDQPQPQAVANHNIRMFPPSQSRCVEATRHIPSASFPVVVTRLSTSSCAAVRSWRLVLPPELIVSSARRARRRWRTATSPPCRTTPDDTYLEILPTLCRGMASWHSRSTMGAALGPARPRTGAVAHDPPAGAGVNRDGTITSNYGSSSRRRCTTSARSPRATSIRSCGR